MAFLSELGAWFGLVPGAEPQLVISAPESPKERKPPALEVLLKNVVRVEQEITSSACDLEKKYLELQGLKQERESIVPLVDDWVMVPSSAELDFEGTLALIDEKLAAIQAKLSETNAYKEHVLAKLRSLKDAILKHVSEEGIFRISGGAVARAILSIKIYI